MSLFRPVRRDARPTALVPHRARDLADALIHGVEPQDAARALGASYADDGEGLDVCLADLDDTCRAVSGEPADLVLSRQVSLGWAEAAQERYNSLGCADPLTGLPSIQHVQPQVAALYRAAGDGWLVDADIARSHALVVLDLPRVREDLRAGFSRMEKALRKATAADLLGQRLPECAQVAELNARRLVGLVRRSPDLHPRLAQVVADLDLRLQLSPSQGRCRAWSESLPVSPESARMLIDELAR